MNNGQLKTFIDKIVKEHLDFKKPYLQTGPAMLFDDLEKVYTTERLYDYLLCNAKDMNIKYLVKKDILQHYCNEFRNSGYELCNDDLKEFFNEQIKKEKQKTEVMS